MIYKEIEDETLLLNSLKKIKTKDLKKSKNSRNGIPLQIFAYKKLF